MVRDGKMHEVAVVRWVCRARGFERWVRGAACGARGAWCGLRGRGGVGCGVWVAHLAMVHMSSMDAPRRFSKLLMRPSYGLNV